MPKQLDHEKESATLNRGNTIKEKAALLLECLTLITKESQFQGKLYTRVVLARSSVLIDGLGEQNIQQIFEEFHKLPSKIVQDAYIYLVV